MLGPQRPACKRMVVSASGSGPEGRYAPPPMATESQRPDWFLVSILFSSFPVPTPVFSRLYKAAFDLHRTDADELKVKGPLFAGEVRNLKKTVSVGALTGQAFEARLDTETGEGLVRYIVTERGIEAMASRTPRALMN